jgi:hypothetical protein
MISKAPMVVTLLVVLGIFCFAGSSPDATSQIKAEIERLQQALKDKSVTDPDLPDIDKMLAGGLKGASEALSSGHVYLSLEMLGREWDLYNGARAVVDGKAEVTKGGLPAFEAAWNRTSLRVTSLDQSVKDADWSRLPVAVQALAQSADGRTQPMLEGGRGFATSTAPKDGLLYVGEAQGEAEFAKFCATVNLSRRGSPLPLRSMLPELQTLQEKTNAAFQPPRSIDLHTRFIALNSTIKLANELDASRYYAGSLYQYLDAVRHYGMLSAAPLDAPKQAELKDAIAALHKKFDASQQDDSIAQLFLERAESQVAHPDGSAPSADEWRSAWVIVDQVLPAYAAAQKPASPLQQASGKTIDITLVRWPYT